MTIVPSEAQKRFISRFFLRPFFSHKWLSLAYGLFLTLVATVIAVALVSVWYQHIKEDSHIRRRGHGWGVGVAMLAPFLVFIPFGFSLAQVFPKIFGKSSTVWPGIEKAIVVFIIVGGLVWFFLRMVVFESWLGSGYGYVELAITWCYFFVIFSLGWARHFACKS